MHYGKFYKGIAYSLLFTASILNYTFANPCEQLQQEQMLEVSQNTQKEFRLPVAIQRVAIGNPSIADVSVTSRQSILLTAQSSGVTNMSVWTACSPNPVETMIFVSAPSIADLNPVFTQQLNPSLLPSQVQTDIRFVEVSRNRLKEVGVSLLDGRNNFLLGVPGASASGGNFSGNLPSTGDGFNILFRQNGKKFLGMLNALEQSGFAYTLAQPSLVALSGQTASFLAGGEFPVPVPSTSGDSISIEYKEFGVRLNLTPTVVDRNRILLKVAPEVSELNFNTGVDILGTRVPALNVRRTDTSIALADGESFVISGLISTSNSSGVDKLPGLGSIPVLGAFFRSSRLQREERELLMIVTPRLVQPLAADAPLPDLPGADQDQFDPNFFEFMFLENSALNRRDGLSR